MEFHGQEYWSGLLFPTPGDLPSPGIEPTSLMSPALASLFFSTYLFYPKEDMSQDTFNCYYFGFAIGL